MLRDLRIGLVMLVGLTVCTGVVYPAIVTGVAQVFFRGRANGDLIVREGKPVGATQIGQAWDDPRYIWGRPSATRPAPYNAAASSGSNLGPTNPALRDRVAASVAAWRAAHPQAQGPVPVDLVTTSASGLDPHITPAAALWQAERVATARGLDPEVVRAMIRRQIEPRQLGILGEPRVHVLRLNLALDALP
jgi:potassium-transporting ATPase KdpC subunit